MPRVSVNPYEPPTADAVRSSAVLSVNIRLATALFISCCVVAFLVLFRDKVSFSLSIVLVGITAVALGLMPRGYGKYDWLLGLCIVLLGPIFGVAVWCGRFSTIDSLDRLKTLGEHVVFLGFFSGIAAAIPYAATRMVAMRVIEGTPYRQIFTHRKRSTREIDTD